MKIPSTLHGLWVKSLCRDTAWMSAAGACVFVLDGSPLWGLTCAALHLNTIMLVTNQTEFCSETRLDKVFPPYLWVHLSSRWHISAVKFISLRRNEWVGKHPKQLGCNGSVGRHALSYRLWHFHLFRLRWWRPGCCCRLSDHPLLSPALEEQ